MTADLAGTLLIASPELSRGKFLTLTREPLRISNEFNGVTKIDVVALECRHRDEIPSFIKDLKEEFEQHDEQTDNVKNCIRWFNEQLEHLSDDVWEKELPKMLQEIIARDLRPTPKPEQMIFLCGAIRVEK